MPTKDSSAHYGQGGDFLVVGRVKWFSESKGFGFVEDHEGHTIYFHHSAVKNKDLIKDLKEGTEVSFEVYDTDRGPEAYGLHLKNFEFKI